MRKNIKALLMLSGLIFLTFACTSKAGEGKNISFKVYGNCEMCKETIEGSLKGVEGVNSAVWDVDKKMMSVTFDSTKTNELAIHKKIASVGYDTELEKGDDLAYKGLHQCCQYDRKK
jgi:periplasmic mercuric ion binding protein